MSYFYATDDHKISDFLIFFFNYEFFVLLPIIILPNFFKSESLQFQKSIITTLYLKFIVRVKERERLSLKQQLNNA